MSGDGGGEAFSRHRLGPYQVHQFKALRRLGVAHGVFTRHGGVSEPPYQAMNCANRTDDARSIENRHDAIKRLGLALDRCYYASGNHSDGIVNVDRLNERGDGETVLEGVDGLIARRSGSCLMLSVADCIPAFFACPETGAVGLIHAGWRGVDLEILPKAVRLLEQVFGARPARLQVAFGPAIRPASYRVRDPNQADDPRWRPYLRAVDGIEYEVDIISFARRQLFDAGIAPANLADSGICTSEHVRDFYSCHLEGYRSGRFLNFIVAPGG